MLKFTKYISVIGLTLLLVLAGCSSGGSDDPANEGNNNEPANESNGNDENAEKENSGSLTVEEDMATQLEEEDNVEKAMIQLEENDENKYVNADITVKEEADGEEIAKEYADKLKEEYPDHIIDMIIIYDGDVLYQDTFK